MGGKSSKEATPPAPVVPEPLPPPPKKVRVMKEGYPVYKEDDAWFHDLAAVQKWYPQDTYYSRLRMCMSGMSLGLLITGPDRLEKYKNLLVIQREKEQKEEKSPYAESDVINAWKIVRWCSHEDGSYLPRYGRVAFFTVPMTVAASITALNVQFPIRSATQGLLYRMGAHGMVGLGISLASIHSSPAHELYGIGEHITCIGVPTLLTAVTGYMGEFLGASQMNNMKISLRARYNLGGLQNILLPSVGVAMAAHIAKSKEWSTMLHTDPGIPVLDGKGELIDVSADVGYFASRETACSRLTHAATAGLLVHLYSQLTTTDWWVKQQKKSAPMRFLSNPFFKAYMFCAVYVAMMPITTAGQAMQTSVASRRVSDEYAKAGVPVVHYNRGF